MLARLLCRAVDSSAGAAATGTAKFICRERRSTSSLIRKRRRAYWQAIKDPSSHPGTLHRLREKAAEPTYDTLRYIAENKIGKAVTTAERRALWFDMRFKRYAPQFLGQFKPRMKFWTAALEESQLPPPRLPEVAIAGRSNSGKSTLVNYLCGQHSAHVKRTPGSTTELVFWQIGKPAQLCLVDLPGYGFAYAPDETRLQWTEFTLWYVRARRNLQRVLVLLDSRFGLKPADKEMIAYLERHNVKWQIVLTKTDKVLQKDLARKLTILREDVSGYRKMAEDPIPVSALKKQGMDALRATLDGLKVQKDVVCDGIQKRVYDLLELRRARRAEKARKKREKRREEQERKAAEEAARNASAEDDDLDVAQPGLRDQSLGQQMHSALEDYHLGDRWQRHAVQHEQEQDEKEPVRSVAEAHYTLDDRDSKRVDSFMQELFPNFPGAVHFDAQSVAGTDRIHANFNHDIQQMPSEVLPSVLPSPNGSDIFARQDSYYESDSDSDGEDIPSATLPPVLRFDPQPSYGLSGLGNANSSFADSRGSSPHSEEASMASPYATTSSSPFPSLSMSPNEQIQLRKGWLRPPSNKDRIYDADDFVSPSDLATGLRPRAPDPPSPQTGGQLLAEARKRYEREWAMELEDVEHLRTHTSATKTAAPNSTGSSNISPGRQKDPSLQSQSRPDRTRKPNATFIGKLGLVQLPKGHAKWKIIGRPPARILKQVRQRDVAKSFGFSDKRSTRKRNLGKDLTEEQANEKWLRWAKKNSSKNFERVQEAQREMEEIERYGEVQPAFGRPQPSRQRRSHQFRDKLERRQYFKERAAFSLDGEAAGEEQ